MADRTGEIEVQDARLHPRHARFRIDLEHPVHLRGHDDDRVVERGRSAREARTAAARDEGPAVPPRDPDGGGHLVGRPREAHRDRSTDGDAGVSRVQRELERLGARATRTDGGSEVGNEVPEKFPKELIVYSVGVRDTRDATD